MASLKVRELKAVTDAIFKHILDDLKVAEIPVRDDADFYWDVSSDQLRRMSEGPPRPDIGRLSDDWAFLESILRDQRHAVSLMLIHVAPLLRYLGEEVGQ
jgi:hypothetical protein